VYTNIFGKICSFTDFPMVLEAPHNGDGRPFVDLAAIGNNPLRQGSAVINLTLAKADRVTVKIFDVSGRLVRTLADGQLFKAGKVDPALTWDGLDNTGRPVARGAYFVSVRYRNSGFAAAPKMIVLR
jgi:flagellar hook assembly protein FlgD